MIALVLVGVALFIGFTANMTQLGRLQVKTRNALNLYAARAQREPQITSRAQVAHIIAGTSHPGWVLSIAFNRLRFVARWAPQSITVKPRRDFIIPARLTDPLTGLAFLLGDFVPARVFVNGAEIVLYPVSDIESITDRTIGLALIAALFAVVFAFLVADRMASDTLRPLRTLHEALEGMAHGDTNPNSLPETGADEIGQLIATYNRAIETANKARTERDAAEEREHQFIADAGHQLRTPLTVLSGFVGILRKGQLRHPDDGPKILQKMDQQIAIMRKLVERLMLLESWRSADATLPDPMDVGELVAAVVDPMAASHPNRTVRIRTVRCAFASADRTELTHAIINIVANALKYAPEGAITVDVTADEKRAYIEIADEGPGIDADTLPHIFDRFYRGSQRNVPGSGLGLAIAKVAVERANGTIRVESSPGNGARFTIALPRVCAIVPVAPAEPSLV